MCEGHLWVLRGSIRLPRGSVRCTLHLRRQESGVLANTQAGTSMQGEETGVQRVLGSFISFLFGEGFYFCRVKLLPV